jgi:hypothetical protein
MKKVTYGLLASLLFFSGFSLALADVTPTPLTFFCAPYTANFTEAQAYIPVDHTSTGCTFAGAVSPNPGDTTYILYRGTPGQNPEFIQFVVNNTGTDPTTMGDVVFSGSGPNVPGEEFFAASFNQSDAGLGTWDSFFRTGGAAPGPYSLKTWRYGAPATVTADTQIMQVGDPVPSLTATISGFIGGDTLATSGITGAALCTTTATSASPAGDYPITCTIGTLFSTKYALDTFVAGVLHVAPAAVTNASTATIVITPYAATYDGHSHTATVVATGTHGEDLSADVVLTGTTHTQAGDHPSDAWTFHDSSGTYSDANGTVHDNIAKAPLTVTANNQSMTTGSALPSLTSTISGFVNTETLATSGTTGAATCNTTATNTSPAGDYPITCSVGTLVANNYAFTTFVNGTLHVTTPVQSASVTTVTCPATVTYSGLAQTPCSATVTGAGGLNISLPVTYTNNTNVGTAQASASFAGDATHTASSNSKTFTIAYRWDGFLQPINDTAHQIGLSVSVFKGGSTVPVKFQIKKADGTVVQSATAPLWSTPQLLGAMSTSVDELVYSDPASSGNTFKWDGTQYGYNWSTKGVAAGNWYRISAQLDDGTVQSVVIGLR